MAARDEHATALFRVLVDKRLGQTQHFGQWFAAVHLLLRDSGQLCARNNNELSQRRERDANKSKTSWRVRVQNADSVGWTSGFT